MLTRYDGRDYACRGLYGEVNRGASADGDRDGGDGGHVNDRYKRVGCGSR